MRIADRLSTCLVLGSVVAVVIASCLGSIESDAKAANDRPVEHGSAGLATTSGAGEAADGRDAGPLVTSVAVGSGPILAVDDSADGYVYVANEGSDNVSLINGTTVVGNVSVGEAPTFSCYDSSSQDVYVENQHSYSVSVLRGPAVAATQYDVGVELGASTYDSANGYVYIPSDSGVTVFNGTALVGTVTVDGDPSYTTFDSGNGYVYSSEQATNVVSVILGTTVVGTVKVGNDPYGLTYDSGNGDVYVTDFMGSSVSVINGTTLVGTVNVGTEPQFETYDSAVGEVYVSDSGSDSVSVIDGTTLVGNVSVGDGPWLLGSDPTNGLVYVPNLHSNNVSVIDGASVLQTINVGTNPYSTSYDPSNGYVYVANSGSANLSVIEPNTAAKYSVTVSELGLPAGTLWWVNLTNGQSFHSTKRSIRFAEASGTYSYSTVSADRTYKGPNGKFTVRRDRVKVAVEFTDPTGTALGESAAPTFARSRSITQLG